MSFFDSEIVRSDVARIHEIQQEIAQDSMKYFMMNMDQKLEHISKMEELLEKQKILHARMKLANDDEANQILDKMKKSAVAIGIPAEMGFEQLFQQMETLLVGMKNSIIRST